MLVPWSFNTVQCESDYLWGNRSGGSPISFIYLLDLLLYTSINLMQSFRINRLLHACLLHARLLHDYDVTHISSIDHFATSISLREHANERYADRFDV